MADNMIDADFLDAFGLTQDDIVKADDTGISVTQGGTVLAGSQKTWADMGITNWGDQSTDIWSDKTYVL